MKTIAIKASKKVVGTVAGHVFFKSIYGSRHFLRRPPAIAFDVQSLADATRAGAVVVVVTDMETGTTYTSSIPYVYKAGFSINRGFGNQIALPMSKWEIKVKEVAPDETERTHTPEA